MDVKRLKPSKSHVTAWSEKNMIMCGKGEIKKYSLTLKTTKLPINGMSSIKYL